MTASEKPFEILHRNGVILDGHFILKSGKHSAKYINKDEVYTDPLDVTQLCIDLGFPFRDDKANPNQMVDTVIGPAVGGVILSHAVAHWLSLDGRRVRSVFADKDDQDPSRFVIKRGYDKHIRRKRVLVVEDILTTGGSVRATIEAVRAIDGVVLGVAALCNRGRVTAGILGVPRLLSLINMAIDDTWDAADCPLCRSNTPINTDVGHGAALLAANPHKTNS